MKFKRIIIIHPGKANYPEVRAYKNFFRKSYEISVIRKDELKATSFSRDTILWFIMGFYPKKYSAGFIIHDYRSLSVGLFPRLKDMIKKYFNSKPNLRIFLNENIARQMNFKDNVPKVFIDMGVPDEIEKYIIHREYESSLTYKYDFIYVGEISKERESHKMIEKFLKKYGEKKTFLLVGNAEYDIKQKFKKHSNIFFTGRVPQEKVFEFIKEAEFCVNFIPNKYPYYYQTSTKLLEYAALRKKIISSNIKSNIITAKKYNIKTLFVNDFEFPSENVLIKIAPNTNFDFKKIKWSELIKNSGIRNFIEI